MILTARCRRLRVTIGFHQLSQIVLLNLLVAVLDTLRTQRGLLDRFGDGSWCCHDVENTSENGSNYKLIRGLRGSRARGYPTLYLTQDFFAREIACTAVNAHSATHAAGCIRYLVRHGTENDESRAAASLAFHCSSSSGR